jgi:hypothetical protein
LEYEYQRYRHATVEHMADRLIARDIPIVRPPVGHAVFIDAPALCPHLKTCDYPGIGLVNVLYLEGGIRAVELGSVMFGRPLPGRKDEIPASRELVRLAFRAASIPKVISTTSSKCWISSGGSAMRSRLTGSQNRRRFCATSRRISIARSYKNGYKIRSLRNKIEHPRFCQYDRMDL